MRGPKLGNFGNYSVTRIFFNAWNAVILGNRPLMASVEHPFGNRAFLFGYVFSC